VLFHDALFAVDVNDLDVFMGDGLSPPTPTVDSFRGRYTSVPLPCRRAGRHRLGRLHSAWREGATVTSSGVTRPTICVQFAGLVECA
jgi:hypothetical protein